MNFIKACFFTIVIFLCACSKQSAPEYVGHWTNTKDARSTLEIKQNDGNYIIKLNKINPMTQHINPVSMSGTIKDGMLAIPNGIGDTVLNIDKSNGHITSEFGEFEKK